MKHQELLRQLRDIHGIDPVGWWPPAIGWWLLALGAATAVGLLFWLARDLYRYPWGSWRRDARDRLIRLRRQLKTRPPRETAAELSELMRRIAMARFEREDCASLTGDDWLQWLERHDPIGFPWATHGRPMTRLPYAPGSGKTTDDNAARAGLKLLLDAALRWSAAKADKKGKQGHA